MMIDDLPVEEHIVVERSDRKLTVGDYFVQGPAYVGTPKRMEIQEDFPLKEYILVCKITKCRGEENSMANNVENLYTHM